MEMYCGLRQFDRAKEYLEQGDADAAKYLMRLQAEWCKTANDPTLAVDILSAAGDELASVKVGRNASMHAGMHIHAWP